jgi:hypothetical protein
LLGGVAVLCKGGGTEQVYRALLNTKKEEREHMSRNKRMVACLLFKKKEKDKKGIDDNPL